MKIDGREISRHILKNLKERVEKLKEKGITPHLYIVTFGKNSQTESYLKQKLLRASQIGAEITIKRFSENVSAKKVKDFIERLNKDKRVHGIIIQRPLIKTLSEEEISQKVALDKDVDGFCSHSKFSVPVALAVLKMIESIIEDQNILDFLKSKKITIVGKGITAGKPIIKMFQKLDVKVKIVDSKTSEKRKIFKSSDIIVSAVGKNVIKKEDIKKGVILIGVGMHAEKIDKLQGDYNEKEIQTKASYYTPMPGGVGPVNVSYLMKNLVEASEKQL